MQVAFPWERPPQAVSDEVTPLLQPQGRATVLPQSKATAGHSAGWQDRASSARDRLDPGAQEGKATRAQAAGARSGAGDYPVQSLDLQTTMEMLETLVAGAKITVDQQAGQLNVFATPDEQAAIKKYLDEMSSPVSQDRQSRSEVYAIEKEATEDFLEQLKGWSRTQRSRPIPIRLDWQSSPVPINTRNSRNSWASR